jgi:hypothetical protein
MTSPTSQTIHVHNRVHRAFAAQPITYGVPWPQGAVKNVEELTLTDEGGVAIPAGFTELNRWPDGSVQWSLIDTSLDLSPSVNRSLKVAPAPAPGKRADAPKNAVSVRIDGDTARIGNGLVEVVVSTKGELLKSWTANGRLLAQPGGFDVSFAQGDVRYSVSGGPRTISIEHANAVRAVLRIDGKHGVAKSAKPQAGDEALLDYFLRIEVFAGRPDVKLTYSFRNRELPTPGISVSSWKAELVTTQPANAERCFTANNLTRHYLTSAIRRSEDPNIVATDTADLANYETAHKEGQRADCFVANPEVLHDPPESKPWWLRDQKFRFQAGGDKCVWPYLGLMSEAGDLPGVLACFGEMTTLHPKSLTVHGSTLEFGIYPNWAGPLSITQGAGRSHVMWIGPLPAGASDLDIQTKYLSWELGGVHTHVPSQSAVEIKPDLEHVRRCGVFAIDKLPRFEPEKHYLFERKVLDTWIGVSYGQLGAVDQVAPWPAAGFWDYGDQGRGNNEEMHNLVYFQNYLRTGNYGCFEYALAGTRHMMEVDHCAFSIDHFQTGGQVAHCVHHNDGTAYPSHMWFTEYLFAYALTGDREYLEAAKRTCENLLHWIDDKEGFAIIAADQREAGQPMINLTWCYEFTRDRRYLDGCWKIVRNYLMANTAKHGRMLDEKPIAMPVKVCSYGDYAAWEGMFWLWEITRDEELRRFLLSQFEWRVSPEFSGVQGFHRTTDYNPAAYAYYLTGDKAWLRRVAKPFKASFRGARWPIGWVHAMYYAKLALDEGIVVDEDITVQ